MPGQPIIPPGAAPPLAPYSPGMKAGNMVFISGTIPNDGQGNVVGKGDITAPSVGDRLKRPRGTRMRPAASSLDAGYSLRRKHENHVV